MEGYRQGKGEGRMVEKVQGIRSIIGRYKIDRGRLNSIGNGEAKELICKTHVRELNRGNARGRLGTGWRGRKERKTNGTTIIV